VIARPLTQRPLVVLLTGESSYGVLSYLTADLARAFVARGWSAELLDLTRLSLATELRRLQRDPALQLFCAYSGYGADLQVGDVLLYDALQVPYVGLMLDNPCYHPARHFGASEQRWYLHGDDGHHAVSVEISPAGSQRGLFRLASAPWHEPVRALADRAPRALFASKGGDPLQYERDLVPQYRPRSLRFIHDVAEAIGASDTPQRVWEVARARRAASGLSDDPRASVLYHALVAHADHLARIRRATAVAAALLHSPVTFVGGAWAHVSHAATQATFLPPAPLPTVRRLMAEHQVVLNVQPGTTDSIHDRFVLGLHAGAVVVSDTNAFIDAAVGREAFVCWDGAPSSLGETLDVVMADTACAQTVATRGLAVAREHLTLDSVVGAVEDALARRAVSAAAART
jgi:hypothetical protein